MNEQSKGYLIALSGIRNSQNPLLFLVNNAAHCTEKKKGTVPNLKRFRILKRILNLFRFRKKLVPHGTNFETPKKGLAQEVVHHRFHRNQFLNL